MAEREKAQSAVVAGLKAIYDAAMEAKNLQAAYDAMCKLNEVSCTLPGDPPAGLEGPVPVYYSKELHPTEFHVAKADEEKRQVFGWANVAKTQDGATVIDAHGDYIEVEDLEAAAYEHVLKFRATGEGHQGGVKGTLIESFMVTEEKLVAMGLAKNALPQGWWVGYVIEDDGLWADIKKGRYRSFSIQGTAEVEE